METHETSISYTERSKKRLSNLVFTYRAWYYKKYIISNIEGIITGKINTKDNLSILNRGCGQGHKFEKIIQLFNRLNISANFTGIEPSEGMRGEAVKRLCLYEGVKIGGGIAENLDSIESNSIDLVSDEQMHHHNNNENKRKIIKEAHRVLKDDGLLLILDTYEPENQYKKKAFNIVEGLYKWVEGTGPYYTHELKETIKILEEEGFEIIFNKGYKMGVGRLFGIEGIDLTTQIIAKK